MLDTATAIVLAAGQGKRMKSALPKVLHPVLGEPMLDLVLVALEGAGLSNPVVVIGHGGSAVRAHLGDRARIAVQAEQLGTGHAVRMGLDSMREEDGLVAVACGDTPLLTAELFRALRAHHVSEGNAATILTCVLEDAGSYGRIVRRADGGVSGIVEYRDASPAERDIREINSGTYFFNIRELRAAVAEIGNSNAQGEYYLTDAIRIIAGRGGRVGALVWQDRAQTLGVNSPAELAEAEDLLNERVQRGLLASGVRIESRACVRTGPRAEVGGGTVLRGPLELLGATRIGAGCTVGPGLRLVDAIIPDNSRVDSREIIFGTR